MQTALLQYKEIIIPWDRGNISYPELSGEDRKFSHVRKGLVRDMKDELSLTRNMRGWSHVSGTRTNPCKGEEA